MSNELIELGLDQSLLSELERAVHEGQPQVMPTFLVTETGMGDEVMHVGKDGIILVENPDGKLYEVSVDPLEPLAGLWRV